jgi:two-component system chemotaxis response regulator CheY
MKALIVDDSKAMRSFLQHLITQLSFDTEEAEDGRAGLAILIKNDPRQPFDVALVDWDMPVMNGLEFVQSLRRNRDFDSLKVMMVTTQNALERVSAALAAGADDFLMKPVTKEALEEKLQILGLL